MRTFKQVATKVNGRDVTVETLDNSKPGGAVCVVVRATYGATTVEMCHTFGTVDGDSDVPSQGRVKNELDALRRRAAKVAWHREQLRQQLDDLSETVVKDDGTVVVVPETNPQNKEQ